MDNVMTATIISFYIKENAQIYVQMVWLQKRTKMVYLYAIIVDYTALTAKHQKNVLNAIQTTIYLMVSVLKTVQKASTKDLSPIPVKNVKTNVANAKEKTTAELVNLDTSSTMAIVSKNAQMDTMLIRTL